MFFNLHIAPPERINYWSRIYLNNNNEENNVKSGNNVWSLKMGGWLWGAMAHWKGAECGGLTWICGGSLEMGGSLWSATAHWKGAECRWLTWICVGSCEGADGSLGCRVAHLEMWWLTWRWDGSLGDVMAHFKMQGSLDMVEWPTWRWDGSREVQGLTWRCGGSLVCVVSVMWWLICDSQDVVAHQEMCWFL